MNQDNPSGQANVSPPFDFNLFLKKILALGWGLLVLSIVFLYLSSGVIGEEGGESVVPSLFLMVSRTCGIGSFLIGAFALFNRRWTTGVLLFALSIVLPLLAFHLHGTI